MRHIVLLRGINVGGHRKVAMPALRDLLEGHGYEDVVTYVQSGNIVLTSSLAAANLERTLEQQILDGLGVDPAVVVRTRKQIADVIEGNPFPDAARSAPKLLQVNFLSAKPSAKVAADLAAADVAPEEVVLRGREAYAWHPDGVQRSKLARLLTDKRMGVTVTARNWNTVTKLLALADERA
jgi:uncharacterized protein (DUF1697 family)